MKCNGTAAWSLGIAIILASLGIARAETLAVGNVNESQGENQATLAGQTRALGSGNAVFFGDRIRTGADARLNAVLTDGSKLTLGEKGSLVIDQFVYNPGAQGGKLAVRVPKGAFLFVGGKIEGPTGGNVSIQTPVGTLGVRGTTVWGGPIDKGFGVLVLSGEVTVKTRHGTVTLREGQGTMVFGLKPGKPAPWPADRVKRAVASISFGNVKTANTR